MKKLISIVSLLLFSGCVSIPEGITPVKNFEINRYLGKWYEIARLDHSFERGLNNVTAEYSLRSDGGLKVINKGFSLEKNEWKEAEGKAFFVRDRNEGFFKVSFFGPFYGAYIIIDLDMDNYQYSYVAGPDRSYLWFLSRTPKVKQKEIDTFIRKAKELGFNTDSLILVTHD